MYKPLTRRQLPDSEFGLKRFDFGIPVTVDKFSMLAQQYPKGLSSKTHLHKHYEAEISFYPCDSGVLLLEGTEERFEPGALFLVGSEVFHHPVFDSQDNRGLLTVYFDPAFLLTLPEHWRFINRTLHRQARGYCKLPPTPRAAKLMTEVYESFTARGKDWDIVCQGAMLHLISYFVNEEQRRFEAQNDSHHASPSNMELVLRYLDLNFHQHVDPAKCQALAGLSKSRFCERFRQLTGKTLTEYLLELRFCYAETLLASTQRQITDIALSAGFESPSYFSRRFKQRRGCTAKEFRRQHFTHHLR